MNSTRPMIIAVSLAAALCAGCSQESRDEAIDRATRAAKELNGRVDVTPDIVKAQQKRERERQNSQWTIENVSEHPIEACNAKIEEIDGKIKAAQIAYHRALSAKIASEESSRLANADVEKYGEFLRLVRPAYKAAKGNGTWPIVVNSYTLNEESAKERILTAIKKRDAAKAKGEKSSSNIVVMTQRMKDIRRIESNLKEQREKVQNYLENIRSGQLQSEIKGLVGVLNDGNVKMSDLEAVNTTQGIDSSDDIYSPSQNDADKKLLDNFMNDK